MTTRANTVRVFVAVGISDDARQQLIDDLVAARHTLKRALYSGPDTP